jgi:hypothetical protein
MSAQFPYIVSRINGIKIHLQPGHRGIMHRFDTQDNKPLIREVSSYGHKDTDAPLILEGTPEPGETPRTSRRGSAPAAPAAL